MQGSQRKVEYWMEDSDLRARVRITSHFGLSDSHHLRPLLNREILNVGPVTPCGFAQSLATQSDANPSTNSEKLFLREP